LCRAAVVAVSFLPCLVLRGKGERNYHVFYQMINGCVDKDIRDTLYLGKGEKYFHYLNQSGCITANGVNDAEEFQVLSTCLEAIKLTKDEIQNVMRTVGTVLCLGNIRFLEDDKGQATLVAAVAGEEDVVLRVAEMMGTDRDQLTEAILSRYLNVEGNKIKQEQSMSQAVDKRDSLAKALYSWLFLWLVERLNDTMSAVEKRWGFIGLLDIYGFEVFSKNSFEQFCINYANEVLQRHFNQHIFEMEQQEYERFLKRVRVRVRVRVGFRGRRLG
jgi:myosin-5